MDFMLCKLEQTLRSLEQCAVARIQLIEERFTAPDPLERHVPEAFLDACEHLTFVPFGVHERWGEVNESRVFRLDVEAVSYTHLHHGVGIFWNICDWEI